MHSATPGSRFFQVPKRLLEAAAIEATLGSAAGLEEDDSELVFDDVGPEVRTQLHRSAEER
jgi:hypothetical protein